MKKYSKLTLKFPSSCKIHPGLFVLQCSCKIHPGAFVLDVKFIKGLLSTLTFLTQGLLSSGAFVLHSSEIIGLIAGLGKHHLVQTPTSERPQAF